MAFSLKNFKQRIEEKNIQQDILLLTEIAKTSQYPISNMQVPSTMQNLYNILAYKNNEFNHTNDEKQLATQYYEHRSKVSLVPLKKRILKIKEQNQRIKESRQKGKDSYFYLPDISYQSINEYTVMACQYLTLNVEVNIMKKNDLSKKILQRNLAKSKRGQDLPNQPIRELGVPSQLINPRDEEKTQNYIECIVNYSKGNISKFDLPQRISALVGQKFWKLFTIHLHSYQKSLNLAHSSDRVQKQLYLQSLKKLQEIFDLQTPKMYSEDQFQHYITKKYIEPFEQIQKTRFNRQAIADMLYWGKIFLSYRAGRLADCFDLLKSHQQTKFLGYFKEAQKLIQEHGQPVKVLIPEVEIYQSTNIFKSQLIYILRGELKFAYQRFVNMETAQVAWFLVRSGGIFYTQNKREFQQIKEQFIESYQKRDVQQNTATKDVLYNYLYILAYDKFVLNGYSTVLDQDDYLHFLICLSLHSQYFLNNQPQKIHEVQRHLEKALLIFINELLSKNRPQLIYYLALLPKTPNRISYIADILGQSFEIFTNYHSKLAKLIHKDEYKAIVEASLKNIVRKFQNYQEIAEEYVRLLDDKENAIKCLLVLCSRYLMINKMICSEYEFSKCLTTIQKLIHQNLGLHEKYNKIYEFIVEFNLLNKSMDEKNLNLIENIFKNCKFLPTNAKLGTHQMVVLYQLEKLNKQTSSEFDGLQIGVSMYFSFLLKSLKSFDFLFMKKYGTDGKEVLRNYILSLKQSIELTFKEDNQDQNVNEEKRKFLKEISKLLLENENRYGRIR